MPDATDSFVSSKPKLPLPKCFEIAIHSFHCPAEKRKSIFRSFLSGLQNHQNNTCSWSHQAHKQAYWVDMLSWESWPSRSSPCTTVRSHWDNKVVSWAFPLVPPGQVCNLGSQYMHVGNVMHAGMRACMHESIPFMHAHQGTMSFWTFWAQTVWCYFFSFQLHTNGGTNRTQLRGDLQCFCQEIPATCMPKVPQRKENPACQICRLYLYSDACNQPASIVDKEPLRVKVRLLTRRILGPHRGATCAFGLVDFPKGLHQEASAGSAVAPSQRTLTASHAPMVQLASCSTSP